jgi:serine/threonine-protein kinase
VEKTDILPPTRVLAGKYRLGRLLGEGGMGAVYEAEHTGLGSRVAVKILGERFTTDDDAVQRFRREARASAAIRHDNVVRVTDTGTDEEGAPFLVMELLEGESLNAVLKRTRRLAPETAVSIISQVLDGLAAAHACGVVHRDLKPGNVFLVRESDGQQRAKILDFGISKFGGDTVNRELTVEGAVVGTPQYMPPEQVSGHRDLDARADLYSAGVLLYRMVTGRLPFSADSPQKLYEQILAGNPVAPREIVAEIPRELEVVLLRAMAADRDERYPNAIRFKEALQGAIPSAGRIPTLTPPPSAQEHERATSTAPTAPAGRARETSREQPAAEPAPDHSPEQRTDKDHRTRRLLWWGIPLLVLAALGLATLGGLQAEQATPQSQGTGASSSPSQPSKHPPGSSDPTSASGAEPAMAASLSGEPVHFGIARYNPDEMIKSDYSAFVDHLARNLGRPVEFEIVDRYLDLSGKVIDGEVQLAALSSSEYVRAKRRAPGINLLAMPVRNQSASYQGFILARSNSNINELDELEGKTFCYVSRNSTSGYLYPRALFRKHEIDPDAGFFREITFAGHHLGALKMLHESKCDGAAVYDNMLYKEAPKHGMSPDSFRVLASTPPIPHDAYCTPASQPPELTERLRKALLELEPGSERSKTVFEGKADINGFVEANDEDYDPVRQIQSFIDD